MLGPFDRSNVIDLSALKRWEADRRCGNCGKAIPSIGVCGHCAVYLIDLALSSVSEDFPRLVQDAVDPQATDRIGSQRRYDHYEVCVSPEGLPLELGRGSMGITYKATDTHLGCPVALKIINDQRLVDSRGKERFLREARTVARLRHPNIASIYHLGLGQADCFYAMEYIEGETLESRVRREGALPWQTALDILTQVGRALRVAHQQQFIHRDIKPANIMLLDGGNSRHRELLVKVIDFGLVKTVEAEINPGDEFCQGYFAGTPFYASPEQLQGGWVDERSDIYSLGMSLQFMLTGEHPELGERADSCQRNPETRSSGPGREKGEPPRWVAALLQEMVSKEPARRPQSVQKILSQIETAAGEVNSTHGSWRVTSPRWVMLCLAIVGGVAILGLQFGRQRVNKGQPDHPMKSAVRMASEIEAQVLCKKADELVSNHTGADNARAIDLYGKSIALRPDFADAHAKLAFTYLQNVCRYNAPKSQLDAAIESAQRAVTLDPRSPAGFTALASIHTIQGMHWVALGEYHRALEENPQFAPAMRGFCQLWTTVGHPERGLPWAKEAALLEPTNTSSWNVAADANVDLGADEEAQTHYRKCLEINPTCMSAHCGLLHIYLLQGKFELARQECATAQTIDSTLILPLTLKAQIALFSGEYTEAENLYRRLVAMKRDGLVHYYSSVSYLSALGFLRCRAGDLVEGVTLLDEAARLHLQDSEGPQAIYDLAAIRAAQGQTEEGISLLGQAIDSGWLDYRATRLDPRFGSLRHSEKFVRMLGDLCAHVEKIRKESVSRCLTPLLISDYPARLPDE